MRLIGLILMFVAKGVFYLMVAVSAATVLGGLAALGAMSHG